MKEHFGNDALGRSKAWNFLPWHFDFFHRYRPLPEEVYGEISATEGPLLSRRQEAVATELGESLRDLPLLERLLRCENSSAHERIASLLWDSSSDEEAAVQLEAAADSELLAWEAESRLGDRREVQVAQG